MGISQYDPVTKERPAWNAGEQVGAKKALKVKQIWLVRFFLDREGRMRGWALFDLPIDSKLRGCDLVKMKIDLLVSDPAIRNRSMVIQQKTGRPCSVRDNRRHTSKPTRVARTPRWQC